MVYRETMRQITLATNPTRQVTALVYMVDRSHPQYAGRLDLERQLHLVRQGHGRSGANLDYVLATVAEIEAQGCRDAGLHRLAERLRAAGRTADTGTWYEAGECHEFAMHRPASGRSSAFKALCDSADL